MSDLYGEVDADPGWGSCLLTLALFAASAGLVLWAIWSLICRLFLS